MEAEQPIIIIKKKSGHGGHHGGAWKVAYADFVTAMMSLFIVLWLMSSTSKQTQEHRSGYFNDPKGTAAKKGGEGTEPKKKEVSNTQKKEDMAELKKDLQKAIESINALNKLKSQIEITLTEEGLRIEMLEDAKGTFFQVGSAQPTPVLEELLKVLVGQLKDLPNSLSIEGHTDAQQYASSNGYGNWELSTDRANTARREMQGDGIRENQVSQVRGFADQRLHVPERPFDPANRRISLVVQSLTKEKEGPKQEMASAAPKKDGVGAAPAGAEKASEKAAVETKTPPAGAGEGVKPAVEAGTAAAVVAPEAPAKAAGLLGRVTGIFHK